MHMKLFLMCKMYGSRRSRLAMSRSENTQSKHSLGVAAAADWTHSTASPSYDSSLVFGQHRHHPYTSTSYLTLQYQPQRRRRKLSEPDFAGTCRTAVVDLRRSVNASQSRASAGEFHADVTGVRCCVTSYGNTDLDWPSEV